MVARTVPSDTFLLVSKQDAEHKTQNSVVVAFDSRWLSLANR